MIGIIGGSGLARLAELEAVTTVRISTPFGEPSADLLRGTLADNEVIFLPRHGTHHNIAPHKINYRANLWALQAAGVTEVIAVAAVGGIRNDMQPARLAIPDQITDYTYGREHSYFSDDFSADKHLDFSRPYTASLRQKLFMAAQAAGIEIIKGGTYGATQGPRLETAAEIKRMAQDGCDMVGMTGMPETYLARELGLEYATIALNVNWAAGLANTEISMPEMNRVMTAGMQNVIAVISHLFRV